MRFAALMLERYGRFEGCELEFGRRGPDLHVIYGPNEAGKSTSLSAVSDLLFGFPTRSPYNFLFDYSLLRVGAIIEEDGRRLACRRRKSGGATLVDSEDRPLNDADLLAMLRGQTRDTFKLSFSLDQDALRQGGRAIVEAKDNVGQALFAAGSGLTRISDQLKRIEEDADLIWGRRAKASRAWTRGERELEASMRAVREGSLKPKAWLEARQARDDARRRLEELEEERKALLAENQRYQRVRRVAGNVRLRQQLLDQIARAAETVELTAAAETTALVALSDADAATRAKEVSERLLEELEERARQQNPDPEILTEADAIDGLVIEFGGVTKATRDLLRLEGERAAAAEDIVRLRQRAGLAEGAVLDGETVKRLRELVRDHSADLAALDEIETSRAELEDRRERLAAEIESIGDTEDARALIDAVDAARALGSDTDERCLSAQRQADEAELEVGRALGRLRPWVGAADELAALPSPGSAELERARENWAGHRTEIAEQEATAERLQVEIDRLTLQIDHAGSGTAISHQELSQSREERDSRWLHLRAHLLGEVALSDPENQASDYEQAVAAADGVADRRFALAEASARLAGLEASRAERNLEAEQARRRVEEARTRLSNFAVEWRRRLSTLGLPELEPDQLASWLEQRDAALQSLAASTRLKADAKQIEERRAAAISSLRNAMNDEDKCEVRDLAFTLARAERTRREIEAKAEQLARARERLEQLGLDLAALEKRQAATAARAEPRRSEWERLLAGAGLSLDIITADARLAAMDELRQADEGIAGLNKRMDGIRREERTFRERLTELVARLGTTPAQSDEQTLRELRSRLERARSAKLVLDEIAKERIKRRSDLDHASAALAAANSVIRPLLEQTGTADRDGLAEAIDRSRALRTRREELVAAEAAIVRDGDGLPMEELVASVLAEDPDELAGRARSIEDELQELNTRISLAATTHGEASRNFAGLETGTAVAADAAFDAEQARAELTTQAEAYILKRAQALTLRWAIERYRERHQDPLLVRASELFSTLTLGRYSALKVDVEGSVPRLLGISNDGRVAVEVDAMSEGTADQLFLALRLAAVEQSVDAGIRLPFLADDLFVNFDDDRAEAGFRVLAELAEKTQVLFFTHHTHLATIARRVVGEERYSECGLA